MIDILIPALGRPQNAQKVVDSIHAATENPHTILFLCTPGDTAQIEASAATGAVVVMVDGHDYQYARKINAGAVWPLRKDPHPWIFMGADDLDFHPGWDTAALAVHEQTGKLVVGTNDLANPMVIRGQHATHTLVHRDYLESGTVDEPGKLLHEGYHHQWLDNELVQTALWRGQFAFAFNSHVQHRHPLWNTAEMDATYVKALDARNARADRRTFQKRKRLWR